MGLSGSGSCIPRPFLCVSARLGSTWVSVTVKWLLNQLRTTRAAWNRFFPLPWASEGPRLCPVSRPGPGQPLGTSYLVFCDTGGPETSAPLVCKAGMGGTRAPRAGLGPVWGQCLKQGVLSARVNPSGHPPGLGGWTQALKYRTLSVKFGWSIW